MIKTIGLSFLEELIIKRLSAMISEKIPEVQQIILFGSRARGRSDENSDLDLAIVFDSSQIDKKDWERVWDIKWTLLDSIDAEEFPLSLILITLNDLISKNTGLEKEIRKKGIVIWKRN